MSEKGKEIQEEKEKNKERDNSMNKNNSNNNINIINESNQEKNNIITNEENKNEINKSHDSFSSPKSSYGNTYPSPFSSENQRSKSDYSNSKKSNYRSRSKSLSKSRSRESRSRSRSNSSHSHKNYNHRPRNIPQVFVTRLSYYVTKRDLEKEFSRFGEIRNLTLKKGYAFIEYYDKKDAKYAIRELNGRKLFGQSNRIVVEEAKISREEREREKKRAKRSRSREKEKEEDKKEKERDKDYYYKRRSGPKKTDICYNCGKEGHWANECHKSRRDR